MSTKKFDQKIRKALDVFYTGKGRNPINDWAVGQKRSFLIDPQKIKIGAQLCEDCGEIYSDTDKDCPYCEK